MSMNKVVEQKIIAITSLDENSVEFMLAEFNSLQTNILKLEDAKSNRVNFFLVVVAALTAGVPGLVGNANFQTTLSAIISMAALGGFVLGIAVLEQLLRYSQAIVSLHRRAGRIRRWFVQADKTILPYLAFEAGDDRPRMKVSSAILEFRGGDIIVRMVNSISFAIFVVALVSTFYPALSLFFMVGLVPIGIAVWYIQQKRIQMRLSFVEENMKKNIRFPYADVEKDSIILPE